MKDGKDFIDLLARGRNSIEYGSGKKPKKGTQSVWLRDKVIEKYDTAGSYGTLSAHYNRIKGLAKKLNEVIEIVNELAKGERR